MKEFKSIIVAAIAGICAIICICIAVNGLVSFKKQPVGEGIAATGSANQNFTSDLIVWRGSYSAYGVTTKEAYDIIKKDAASIKSYMEKKGVTEEELIFNSVVITPKIEYEYNNEGVIIGENQIGYALSQQISVTSKDVDKVEKISRDVTQLIDIGVEFSSEAPEYYYTKLDELKLQMIEAATQNAKARIDIMAKNAGSEIENLLSANLGVFQITAQNSSSEEYSYGGTFNTSSKEKTASVTVRLDYALK